MRNRRRKSECVCLPSRVPGRVTDRRRPPVPPKSLGSVTLLCLESISRPNFRRSTMIEAQFSATVNRPACPSSVRRLLGVLDRPFRPLPLSLPIHFSSSSSCPNGSRERCSTNASLTTLQHFWDPSRALLTLRSIQVNSSRKVIEGEMSGDSGIIP